MRCRIADDLQVAEPIAWRSLNGPSHEVVRASDAGAGTAASVSEVNALRAQLADSERRRQMESQQARQEGFSQGVSQAQEQAQAEICSMMERVGATLADLANTKRKVRGDAELELLKLSVAIARRIIHREIALDPEALSGVIHSALQKLQNREVSRVRVFPAGAEIIRAALDRFGAPPGIEIYPDATLRAGDLLFETTMGQLDASVETQLQEIQRGLADRLVLR